MYKPNGCLGSRFFLSFVWYKLCQGSFAGEGEILR